MKRLVIALVLVLGLGGAAWAAAEDAPTEMEDAPTEMEALTKRVADLEKRVDELSDLHSQPGVITWDCGELQAQQDRSYNKTLFSLNVSQHVGNRDLMLDSSPLSEHGIQRVAEDCGLTLS